MGKDVGMNPDIRAAVIGLLTLASSPPTEDRGDAFGALLSDILRIRVPLEPNASPDEIVQATADALLDPLQDMVVSFLVAFDALAKVNDAGETSATSAQVLQRLALNLGPSEGE